MLDIAIPGDRRIHEKELEKVDKYQDLKREIRRLWGVKNVDVVPVVLGTLGSVTKNIEQWIDKLGIRARIGLLQKTTLLGTARILRRVLDF